VDPRLTECRSAIQLVYVELGTAHVWIAAGVVLAWYLLFTFIAIYVLKLMPMITFGVIEHQTTGEQLKETVRNIWTNVGLVGALLLTITAPVLMNDDIAEVTTELPILGTLCMGFAGLSFMGLLQATLECVVHLVFSEALNHVGVLRYLAANFGAIGGPVISMSFATFNLCISVILWCMIKVGLPCTMLIGVIFVYHAVILIGNFNNGSKFTPNRHDKDAWMWLWAEADPEIAPRKLTNAKVLFCSKRQHRVLHARLMDAKTAHTALMKFEQEPNFSNPSSQQGREDGACVPSA